MVLRSVAVAWSVSVGSRSQITKQELFDVALKVIPHISAYEGQQKNVLFRAID